ncbi:polymer-forming cytoskeletal protein [Sagittula sp. NFXS13]|uniref:bactofilin family protein n=1 Tax=Sagittula sp. NFXS13 TaxID=2819095 RepID=UPI0032DFD874
MATEIISLLASGIAIGTCGPTIHGYLTSFQLARSVKQNADETKSTLSDIDGRLIQIERRLEKTAPGIYRTNHTGLVFNSKRNNQVDFNIRDIERLRRGNAVLVDRSFTPPPKGAMEAFTDNPENFLIGITKRDSPEVNLALIQAEGLIPWHFVRNGAEMVGFVKKGYLETLGLRYEPFLIEKENEARHHEPTGLPVSTEGLQSYLEAAKYPIKNQVQMRESAIERQHLRESITVGNIYSNRLIIKEGQVVAGSVFANEMIVDGIVIGGLSGNRIRLSSTAKVYGDVKHNAIAIESGAHFEGSVQRQDAPLAQVPSEFTHHLNKSEAGHPFSSRLSERELKGLRTMTKNGYNLSELSPALRTEIKEKISVYLPINRDS